VVLAEPDEVALIVPIVNEYNPSNVRKAKPANSLPPLIGGCVSSPHAVAGLARGCATVNPPQTSCKFAQSGVRQLADTMGIVPAARPLTRIAAGGYNLLPSRRIASQTTPMAKSPQPTKPPPKPTTEAELREERDRQMAQARTQLIVELGGADPGTTKRNLAGEILRLRLALEHVVKMASVARDSGDVVLLHARPTTPAPS
jgi:hypothetical protein